MLAYSSEFQCRLIYFQFKRDRVISNVIFKILNEFAFGFSENEGVGRVSFYAAAYPVIAWLPSNLKILATMQP